MKISKPEEEWKAQLGEEAFRVLRLKGTEKPRSGKYNDFWEEGIYVCRACGETLFEAETKFDAGCGWPSFYKAAEQSAISETADYSHGMKRVEVLCASCGGHLGHVFPDGYGTPTGLRYCINSVSLDFKKKES